MKVSKVTDWDQWICQCMFVLLVLATNNWLFLHFQDWLIVIFFFFFKILASIMENFKISTTSKALASALPTEIGSSWLHIKCLKFQPAHTSTFVFFNSYVYYPLKSVRINLFLKDQWSNPYKERKNTFHSKIIFSYYLIIWCS